MRWRADLHRWATEGVDFIQLREKVFEAGLLWQLAAEGVRLLEGLHASLNPLRVPRLLVNSRPDIAAAARANGIHLTGNPGELTPAQARAVFQASGLPSCFVSASCHTLEEVAVACAGGADLLLFAPVFEKMVAGQLIRHGQGLDLLAQACQLAHPVPVLAMGGVTAHTLPACLKAGAAGAAGIRLFAAARPLAGS